MLVALLLIFATIFNFSLSASQQCSLSALRKCNETDQSDCCRLIANPDLNMEIGIEAGDFILSKHLTPKHSGKCEQLSVTKVRNVLQAVSNLAVTTTDLTHNVDLQMDIALATSSLLVDLQNKTCKWISDCFLIPPGLSCDEYLTQFSLAASLKDPLFSLSCNGNYEWCVWWIEKAVCEENEVLSIKKRYSNYFDNGPIYTCTSV